MGRSRSPKCEKDCIVRCGANVDVELDHKPRVHCQEIWRKKTDFDVEFELEVNPKCKLTHKKSFQKGCTHRSIFNVELDFDCHAEALCTPCHKPAAEFRIDVEVPVSTSSAARGRCGDDSHRKKPCGDRSRSRSSKKCGGSRDHGKYWY